MTESMGGATLAGKFVRNALGAVIGNQTLLTWMKHICLSEFVQDTKKDVGVQE